ncbi:DciA family protein [Sphingomonas sp. BIUV-7]|uniref:DciA family protein n=1 Tax=Sphingomonas natans TaxID=3063330 RepID=A0ABT8YES3_9SPHN|nr:DciA family protein [Sphingomonas sp. BIUV-7]MDO6416871.1 DciA family protein [Sphingomonas sp. BIUV-7]
MTERKTRKTADAPRANGVRSVADMVPQVGAMAFKRFGFVQSSIVSRWAEIVGSRYAEVSTPESIKFPHGKKQDGTLNLLVQGSHATMMQHVAPAIMERVNRFFGYPAVARLAIKQGPAVIPVVRRAPPSLKPMPIEMGESLRAIGDPELRECLTALAGAVVASTGIPKLSAGRPRGSND